MKRVIFSSFSPSAVERIREGNSHAWVALLYHKSWNIPEEVSRGKPFPILNLRSLFLTKDKIAKVHEQGMKVNTYTVNSPKEMKQFIRWGIDGIITNYPDRLIHILKEKFG